VLALNIVTLLQSGCISASSPDRLTPGENAQRIFYLNIIKRKMFARQRALRTGPKENTTFAQQRVKYYYIIIKRKIFPRQRALRTGPKENTTFAQQQVKYY
jgi:hypothetical protein